MDEASQRTARRDVGRREQDDPSPLEDAIFADFPRQILEEGKVPVLILTLPD